MRRGFFITFEGAEGSGKSTQMKRAAAYLRKKGYDVIVLREPGGTRISEAVRKIILEKRFKEMNEAAELLLYLAARAQMVCEKILPALEKGKVVICDRFEDSTLAYQGFGRRMPLSVIFSVSKALVRGRLKPHLTFLLDILPKEGMKRGGRKDRMERESMKFHDRVRQGFLTLARREPRRFRVIDSRAPKENVARVIQEVLDHAL